MPIAQTSSLTCWLELEEEIWPEGAWVFVIFCFIDVMDEYLKINVVFM